MGDLVFLPAPLLENGLSGLIRLTAGASSVDLLRALSGVHQHQYVVVLHLHHAGGDGGILHWLSRRLPAQGTRLDSGDHGAVVGQDTPLPVAGGNGQALAGAFIKGAVRRQDVNLKGVHSASPASIFLAFSTTSRQVPTL